MPSDIECRAVTKIGNGAFSGSGLKSVVIPDSVVSIGDEAFLGCSQMTNAVIGSGVTHIGSNAFEACYSLTSVVIGSSVMEIGERAFYGCVSLTSIIIPGSVTRIGSSAFGWCDCLSDVYFRGNAPDIGLEVFRDANGVISHYLPGAIGWPAVPDLWAGRPTAHWLPETRDDGSLGVLAGQFGFSVGWAIGQAVVVDACTNLANPVWMPVETNNFVGDTYDFRDPLWGDYRGRYYRVRSLP